MSTQTKTIKINNFNLGLFTNLLEESLKVTPQLMLEFRDNMVKSCSFSLTKTLIKLWTSPISKFIQTKNTDDLDGSNTALALDAVPFTLDENFNFYVLKGDIFLKYLGVFDKHSVNIEIFLEMIEGKYQAKAIKIFGKSTAGSLLQTQFELTTDEFLTNKISDYSAILVECTPSEDMFEFILNSKQISEIKSLIKALHKSAVDNTAFLTFKITKNKIEILDKVFRVEFVVDNSTQMKNEMLNWKENDALEFLILKSNFLLIGEHNFTIFTNNNTPKVIFGTKYLDSIIWCMIMKHDNSVKNINDSHSFEEIDELNINEYIEDL